MFQAILILTISAGLALFYLQKAIDGIVRREFDRPYFKAIVHAYCLEFSNVQKALKTPDAPVDYERVRVALKCDFMTLARLLKMSPRDDSRHSEKDRLLVVYSHLGFLSLAVRHLLRLHEKPAILKLTTTFQCLANLVGQRELQFALSHPPAPSRSATHSAAVPLGGTARRSRRAGPASEPVVGFSH